MQQFTSIIYTVKLSTHADWAADLPLRIRTASYVLANELGSVFEAMKCGVWASEWG